MERIKQRWNYLFGSTKGLVMFAVALISLVTAVWGMLSGPMQEFGISDFIIRTLRMQIDPAEREGRIIMLYHTIAVSVVAIEVYLITYSLKIKPQQQRQINSVVTFGYIITLFSGLAFGYFGHSPIFHGLYIFGLSLSFFGGLLLAAALWPWKREHRTQDPTVSRTKGGLDLERVAFFTMAVATLGSAALGAIAGSYWGNGFEVFLAEDLVREPVRTFQQDAVVGHLHIMLTLIAIALTLIVGRWYGFKGVFHKIAMPLMIVGTIVISLGAWSVVVIEAAHTIIYVGSVLVMLAALMLVIFGWDKFIREGVAELGVEKANFIQKLRALTRDPLKFGATWQMVFMNFTVSGVGIFMAVKLDEIFRLWPHREERIILTGHWHILSGIIATIILLYYADLAGLKGKLRQWFGWLVIIGSDLAFAAVTVFSMKRLFVSESAQQPVVSVTILLADIGLGIVLVVLAMLMLWRLLDLFRKGGRWTEEYEETRLPEVKS